MKTLSDSIERLACLCQRRAGQGNRSMRVSLAAVAMTALLLAAATAATAEGPLPFGKRLVPEKFRSLMTLPVGIMLLSTNTSEPVTIEDFGLTLFGQPLPPGVASLTSLEERTHTLTVRGDVWILPFVNVYALGGRVSGRARQLDLKITQVPGVMLPPIAVPQQIAYSGNIVGIGTTLAGGIDRFFASYDINYTSTATDRFDDRVGALTQAVRAGVRAGEGSVRWSAYVGAFHLGIRGTQHGSDLIEGLSGDFSLEARAKQPWNAVFGTQIEIRRHLLVIAEGGLGTRKQLVIGPGVRF